MVIIKLKSLIREKKYPLIILAMFFLILLWLLIFCFLFSSKSQDKLGSQMTAGGYAGVSVLPDSGVNGGEGGKDLFITDLESLIDWAVKRENNAQPEIVYLGGNFYTASTTLITLKNTANISILGDMTGADLKNIGFDLKNSRNIIIRNLSIHEVFYPGDAINIDNSYYIWIDHCELYNKIGGGITGEIYDGLIDINNGASYITVSWSYLHDQIKTSLIGSHDESEYKSGDKNIKVTFHNNWFKNTHSRNPSIRYGRAHLFNNYFENIEEYGIAARLGAHVLSENNYFERAKTALTTEKFQVSGEPHGYICDKGSIFKNCKYQNKISQADCDFWTADTLPYKYLLDETELVPEIVKARAGLISPRKINN